MREIVLDTETTGLDPADGHRVVEIGAVELYNHLPTGRHYHQYINPERTMPSEAFAVHGLGDEFLADKPKFAEIAQAFLKFVDGAKLVIHNAAFDMRFLNAELGWSGHPSLPDEQAIDTLKIARKKYPGASASLDALCRRFGIDNSSRVLHGALLDSEILAEVYLELLGGRQPGLSLDSRQGQKAQHAATVSQPRQTQRVKPLAASRLTDEEMKAHQAFLEELGASPLWKKKAI